MKRLILIISLFSLQAFGLNEDQTTSDTCLKSASVEQAAILDKFSNIIEDMGDLKISNVYQTSSMMRAASTISKSVKDCDQLLVESEKYLLKIQNALENLESAISNK